jgi:pimeloyl-ACP methyl ester carboxylesterase
MVGLVADGHRRTRLVVVAAAAAVVLAAGAVWVATARLGGGPHHAAGSLTRDDSGRLRTFHVQYRDLLREHDKLVRRVSLRYRAWNGKLRVAYVVLPHWYNASTAPALPLVMSPHGRGITPAANLHFWGGLPAFGPFMVISPAGAGRKLGLYSWGWKGQIDDLARMPAILHAKLPWIKVDRRHIYAVGSSMGGQETLMLVARHPQMLAGAAALDSDTNMATRYRDFPKIARGLHLQALAREEIGGTPATAPHAYALRSPIHWVRQIARSGVPLYIWWSRTDRVVIDQYHESGLVYRRVAALHPRAPVTQYVGTWAHSKEFHASARLPLALVELDLIRLNGPIPTPDERDRSG